MRSVAGIILCGGQSSRMGRPKCWLTVGDKLMLPRVVRILSEVVSPIVVVGAPGQELPPLPADAMVVRDSVAGRGPLQGLVRGLAALRDGTDGTESAYLSSCDVPLLRPAFIRRMIDLLGKSDVCVPRINGFLHPLAAVYRLTAISIAEQLLKTGRAGPIDLCTIVPTRIVTADELSDIDPGLQSLQNVNTPEQYAALIRDLAK